MHLQNYAKINQVMPNFIKRATSKAVWKRNEIQTRNKAYVK